MNRKMIAGELLLIAKDLTAASEGVSILKKIGIKPKSVVDVIKKGQTTRVIFKLGWSYPFTKKLLNRMSSSAEFVKMSIASDGNFLAEFKGV